MSISTKRTPLVAIAIATISRAKRGVTADRLAAVLYGKGETYAGHVAGLDGKVRGMVAAGVKLRKTGRGGSAVFTITQ